MALGRLLLLFLLPFLSAQASAAELYGTDVGVIPFAMGRAYSAVADDWLALHYNPAGLALVKGVDFQAFDLRVGTSRDVVKSIDGLKDIKGDSQIASTLNQYAGKHVLAQTNNVTQITVPNFAIGMNYDVNASIDLENPSYPYTKIRYTRDFTASLGGAVSSGKRKDMRLGLKLDLINRRGAIKKLGINELVGTRSTLIDKFNASGLGYGATFGYQQRLPTKGRADITASFVWHNIGGVAFGSAFSNSRPTPVDDEMVAGLAVRLPIGGKQNRRKERRYGPQRSNNSLTFAFDYSHLNYSLDEEHFPKHLHFGMNLDLPLISLQGGVNQGSLTYGAGFDIGIVKVQFASYAEELGSYAGQKKDRRYLLSVGSAVGFGGF